MHPFGRITTALALTLGLAGTSHAATLFAAPDGSSYPTWGPETTYCTILNVKPSNLTVTIRTRDIKGAIVDVKGPKTLASETGDSIVMSPSGMYCEFIVTGSANDVRAMAISRNDTTLEYSVATPAR